MKLYFVLSIICLIAYSNANSISQSSLANGTQRITAAGTYTLTENITFFPGSRYTECVTNSGSSSYCDKPDEYFNAVAAGYTDGPFHLGFFAAIIIEADNVTLDQGGFTLQQGTEHRTLMRFFSLIEISNAPFPPGKGPSKFWTSAESASYVASNNVVIKNGTLRGSSHHQIHGNDNTNVTIENITFRDFEVAAIHMNNVRNLLVQNCDIGETTSSVSPNMSWGIYLLHQIEKHVTQSTNVATKAAALRLRIKNHLVNNFNDSFFKNNGLPCGSLLAGIIVHRQVNVGDFGRQFPTDFQLFNNAYQNTVSIKNTKIHDLNFEGNETGALFNVDANNSNSTTGETYTGSNHVKDIVSAVFDINAVKNSSGTYTGNELSELQIALAKEIVTCTAAGTCANLISNDDTMAARNTINQKVINWAEGTITWQELEKFYFIRPDHDVMFHKNKGVVGIKIDNAYDVTLEGICIRRIVNYTQPANVMSTTDSMTYDAYGVTFTGVARVTSQVGCKGIVSAQGNTNGVVVIGDSDDVSFNETAPTCDTF